MKNDYVDTLFTEATTHGADAIEIYRENISETSVLISQRTVEVIRSVTGTGFGLRLWKDHRVGFGYSSSSDVTTLKKLVHQILANIELLPPSEGIKPAPAQFEDFNWMGDITIVDTAIQQVNPRVLADRLLAQVEAAFAYSSLVKICREARISVRSMDIRLVHSEGLDRSYEKTSWDTELALIGEKNADRKMKFHGAAGVFLDDWNAEAIGEQAAQKTIISLGGTKQPFCNVPVIINNAAMIPILAMIAAGFYGERVDNHMSIFADREGQTIASPHVTLIHDGRMERGYLTAPFDGEGIPCQRTTIIERGRLHGFLHTTESARKRGIVSTGNAVRTSYTQQPGAGHSNLFLQPLKHSPEDLARGMPEGFYLFDTIDPRAIDIIRGKIQLNGDGLWISNGAFGQAISDVSVSADLMDFLKDIDVVANDMLFQPMHPFFGGGYVGSPTVRVKNMTVVGQ